CTRSSSSTRFRRRPTGDEGQERRDGQEGYLSCPHSTIQTSQQAGQPPAFARLRASARGKSELRRAVRRVTPGQGDLKDSGTENTQPFDSRSTHVEHSLEAGPTASLP